MALLKYLQFDLSKKRPVEAQANLPTKGQIQIVIDGGGSVITTGYKAGSEGRIPWAGMITGWYIVGDQSGSINLSLYADSLANFPPDVNDTISGAISPISQSPRLESERTNSSTDLTGWQDTLTEGHWIGVNVDSVTSIQKAVLAIDVTRIT